jgi:hypothetical protein
LFHRRLLFGGGEVKSYRNFAKLHDFIAGQDPQTFRDLID